MGFPTQATILNLAAIARSRSLAPLGVLTLFLSSCAPATQSVDVEFLVSYGDQRLSCDSPAPSLADFRAYLTDFELLRADGSVAAVTLRSDRFWQNDRVAMIDLEDAIGSCRNGTTDMNANVLGEVAAGDYTGLRFTVGVPFELNHRDPLQADAPLDDSAMHWHWRGGYKFMRVAIDDGEKQSVFHLGSTGCQGVIGAIESCRSPNRPRIELTEFQPGKHRVRIDLKPLFADAGPAQAHCLSGPQESACAGAFKALGLSAEIAGRATGLQHVFEAVE